MSFSDRWWKYFIFALFFVIVLGVGVAAAELDLPDNLKIIKDFNAQYVIEFLAKMSIPLAFLAGVLSFVSPCILPLIPAFFAYTFKERRQITKMTLFFFLGFTLMFVSMGIAAALLGKSISSLRGGLTPLIIISGLFLVFFGYLSLTGKGFSSFFKISRKVSNDAIGIFLMGIFFALGWSACLGPILAGILTVVAVQGSVPFAASLLFIYSLGILTPLLILSLFFDRFNLADSRWMKQRVYKLRLLKRTINTSLSGLISGILFISLGLIFVIFGSTSIINATSPFGSPFLFNELQYLLLDNPEISSLIGLVFLIVLLALIGFTIFKRGRE